VICVFFLFCSMIINSPTAPLYDGAVARYASNVLIAHNSNDGQYFDEINVGNLVRYYNGEWKDYRVTEVLRYRAIPSDSLAPTLFDGAWHSTAWVYGNIYNKSLILQTCIYKDGDWQWGRLFVVAQ
jgi:hypothetical protein